MWLHIQVYLESGTGTGDEVDDLVGEDDSGEVTALDTEIQAAQADAESYTGGPASSSKASAAASAKRVANQKTLSMMMQKRAKAAGMFSENGLVGNSYSYNDGDSSVKLTQKMLRQIIREEEIHLALTEAKKKKKVEKDAEEPREDAWDGGDNLSSPMVWADVLDMIKEEMQMHLVDDVDEDVYGEIPAGKQMIYSKPEALDAVSGIAGQTDCPVTQDALMQLIQSLRGGSGCG